MARRVPLLLIGLLAAGCVAAPLPARTMHCSTALAAASLAVLVLTPAVARGANADAGADTGARRLGNWIPRNPAHRGKSPPEVSSTRPASQHVPVGSPKARTNSRGPGPWAARVDAFRKRALRCYALRYPDLLSSACKGDVSSCDFAKLQEHWDIRGQKEGRKRGCALGGRLPGALPQEVPRCPCVVVPAARRQWLQQGRVQLGARGV
jgi:hypothetical protein